MDCILVQNLLFAGETAKIIALHFLIRTLPFISFQSRQWPQTKMYTSSNWCSFPCNMTWCHFVWPLAPETVFRLFAYLKEPIRNSYSISYLFRAVLPCKRQAKKICQKWCDKLRVFLFGFTFAIGKMCLLKEVVWKFYFSERMKICVDLHRV